MEAFQLRFSKHNPGKEDAEAKVKPRKVKKAALALAIFFLNQRSKTFFGEEQFGKFSTTGLYPQS